MSLHKNLSRLLLEELKKDAEIKFKVTGNSMAPLITKGDYLTIRRSPVNILRRGDIVLVATDSDQLTHRLMVHKDGMLILKGDGLLNFDMPVREDRVLGKVITIMKKKQQISLTNVYVTMINRVQGLLGAVQGKIHQNLVIEIVEGENKAFILWLSVMRILAKSFYIPIKILDFIIILKGKL